ncbi:hypothetical protein LPJ38_33465 [Bradyrhizobium daqingense]|uniref:Uncharacterized protein n=1 Tax=Bradyrhizobium daqingense TaxID=993502 RepID=A0A562KZU1_9BRAD|nr:hypothetical protein [Bradyrhizobium daqingense]TWI00744.1 hypothetical protein IQ17_04747 [Bradyrhizobium daqingense]UFS88487.1 hypothetical protein LPJ38_33465 [Bradyrhizobium daqingense]
MLEWLDLSGLGPHLARFRRWLDRMPKRDFSELGVWGKLGRLMLMLIVVGLICAPAIWLLSR